MALATYLIAAILLKQLEDLDCAFVRAYLTMGSVADTSSTEENIEAFVSHCELALITKRL